MTISTEVVIAVVTGLLGAQASAIVWLAHKLVDCYADRIAAQEEALGVARQGAHQTERAVRAGRELAR